MIDRVWVKEYFNKTYDTTERLFGLLKSDKAFYQRPEPLRHPLIFYFGHVAVFYINKLKLAKLIDRRINEKFESIFAVGVDEMSWDDLDERHYDWPSVEEVREYRKRVREVVNEVIDRLPLGNLTWDSSWWVIMMGIEHENIHIETSSVLFRQLDIAFLKDEAPWPICKEYDTQNYPKNDLVRIEGGMVRLGRELDDEEFYGWDNEYGKEEIEVAPFEMGRYLVSNGEFLEFVEEGGYEKDEYWEEEGRAWKEYKRAKHPTFWIERDGKYYYRAINEILPLPLDWPVDVNYHEAKAFCNYKSAKEGKNYRLPTEAEWHRAYQQTGIDKNADANISLRHYFSACAVDRFKHGEFCDMIGNVWQWTETPIYPFEGFEVHPIYDDFSTPTFDDRHNIIKGGSFISIGNEADPRSRYAFRRHFFQHAGFRYVVSDHEPAKPNRAYESDEAINQYIEFHYGDTYFGVPNYLETLVQKVVPFAKNRDRALDIGCSVGRASFELSKHFEEVTGLDFSARFIHSAVLLQQEGLIRYKRLIEGELHQKCEVWLEDFDFNADRCSFYQADACNLKPLYRGYDLVLAINLIDRLYDPKKFLEDIQDRINDGGILLIASPFTWLEEFTPKEKWLGGFERDGVAVRSAKTLKELLEENFELLDEWEEEFLIRESERKFQHSRAWVGVWKKR